MKFTIFKAIVYIFIGLTIIWLFLYEPTETNQESDIFLASIESIADEVLRENEENTVRTIFYNATVIEKRHKGETFIIEDTYEVGESFHTNADTGDQVLVYLDFEGDGQTIITGYIVKFVRTKQLALLLGIFIVLLIIITGVKGIKALVSLGLTLLLVIRVILPRILKGDNPVFISVIVTVIITVFTLLIISGFNKKAYATMIGTISGVFIGGGLAILVTAQAKVMGLTYEDAQFLRFFEDGITFDFSGLLFASILLGALGAVMDVCMSIASSIEEVKHASPYISRKDLFISGMHVGKDVMGTMINTLILAYAGSSMLLMLIYLGSGMPFIEIINDDLVVTEIIRALAGTIGLIVAIPITALSAASLIQKESY
jgi:uncharacterized membrane protein